MKKNTRTLTPNAASFLAVFTLLSGCYTYQYTPPIGADGLSCVKKCTVERNQCRQVLRVQENNEEAKYQADVKREKECSKGRTKQNARQYCEEPGIPALNFGSSGFCEDDFDQCYETCGGSIKQVPTRF